jgi:hypothetical protein
MVRGSRRHRQTQKANRQIPAPTPISDKDIQTVSPGTDATEIDTEKQVPERSTAVSVNPGALQRGQTSADETKRSKNEQNREQNLPLPSRIIGPSADGQEEDKTEATNSEKDQPEASKTKAYISAQLRKVWASWKDASAGEQWMIAITGILAFINLIYLGVGGCQWSVMSGQLAQMQSESRSWVGLDEAIGFYGYALTTDPNGTARTTCQIVPKNFGNYPATILRVHAELVITQDVNAVMERMEAFHLKPKRSETGHILFPGTDKITKELTLSLPFSQRIPVASADDRFELYILGYILYRDQFGHHHHTRFAYRSENPNTDPPTTRERLSPKYVYGFWKLYYANAD